MILALYTNRSIAIDVVSSAFVQSNWILFHNVSSNAFMHFEVDPKSKLMTIAIGENVGSTEERLAHMPSRLISRSKCSKIILSHHLHAISNTNTPTSAKLMKLSENDKLKLIITFVCPDCSQTQTTKTTTKRRIRQKKIK